MKIGALLISLIVATGCQHATETEYARTKPISEADISKLPARITYGDLLRRWGPANYGDPYSRYQTTDEKTELAIFMTSDRDDPIHLHQVVAMYMVRERDWSSSKLIWGHDILSEMKIRNEN